MSHVTRYNPLMKYAKQITTGIIALMSSSAFCGVEYQVQKKITLNGSAVYDSESKKTHNNSELILANPKIVQFWQDLENWLADNKQFLESLNQIDQAAQTEKLVVISEFNITDVEAKVDDEVKKFHRTHQTLKISLVNPITDLGKNLESYKCENVKTIYETTLKDTDDGKNYTLLNSFDVLRFLQSITPQIQSAFSSCHTKYAEHKRKQEELKLADNKTDHKTTVKKPALNPTNPENPFNPNWNPNN